VPSLVAATDYGVVNVRVRARRADMLTAEMWNTLCSAESFNALLTVLGDTAYGPYLRLARALLTPRRVAYQIRQHLADAYRVVIDSVPESRREFVVHLRRLFEVDNLKAVLRGVEAGATWEQVRFILSPLAPLPELPTEKMLKSGKVGEAVEALKGTPYYDTLSHAMERYTAEQNLFPLEVALDLEYVRELWAGVNGLPGEDRKQVLRIVGTLIDVTNLLWALRYRVYHDLSEEEIINYTVPFGHQVLDGDIRSIASGGDIVEVIERVFPRISDARELMRDPRTGLRELEIRLQREVMSRCRAVFLGNPFHLGIPVAFLLLKEYEVQDLTVLIEGKAAQMPREVLESHLVLGKCRPGDRQA
jgi:vacuolar-type H+-ATPase subunit C/Vma6